jgi:uncharacterized membrane protein
MHREYQQQEQQQVFHYEGYQAEEQPSMEYQQPFPREYQQLYTQFSSPGQMPYPQQEHFSLGLVHSNAHVAAALCYSVGWLSGLIFMLFATESRYVRYHGLQSLIFFGGINLLDIGIFSFLSSMHRLFFVPGSILFVSIMAFLLLNFVAFVGWLVGMVQAYRGKYYKLPIAGNIAASIMHRDVSLK